MNSALMDNIGNVYCVVPKGSEYEVASDLHREDTTLPLEYQNIK